MNPEIGHIDDSARIVRKQRLQLVSSASMNYKPGFNVPLAKQAKVMQWQNRFAAEPRRGMLGDDCDAR
jgi:hypothetical protein